MTHGRTLSVATDWVAMTGLCADDRYLMMNPYFHMFGLKAGILACMASGATMLPEAVFDVDRVLRPCRRRGGHRPSRATDALSGHPRPSRAGRPSTVHAAGGGDRSRRHPRRAGPPHRTTNCRSRPSSPATASPRRERRRRRLPRTTSRPSPPRSAGPGPASRSASSTTTVTSPPGEPGEVVLRGGSVMAGYLDDPEATALALSPEGWLRTGDIGVVDGAGYLRIVGRVKDMFIVGGFNAYPAEIENLMLRPSRHPPGGGDRHSRRTSRRGRDGLRGDRSGEASAAGDRRVVPGPDGQLQGAEDGGDRRRAAR